MIRQDTPVALGAAVVLTLGAGIWAGIGISHHDVAPETLTDVHGAIVITPGRAPHRAVKGERLRPTDILQTGVGASATLLSPGRRLLLGPGSQVYVGTAPGPAYIVQGSIGLQVQRGAPVALGVFDQIVATVAAPAAIRVDRSFQARIATLQGTAALATTGGATLTLPALTETTVTGAFLQSGAVPLGTLASAPTSLDAALDPSLAHAQGTFEQLANAVDADPSSPVVFGVQRTATTSPSEVALPRAIGIASALKDTESDRIARAVAMRADGAAWAVIATTLDADVTKVTTILSGQLNPSKSATGGPSASPTPGSPGASPVTGGTTGVVPPGDSSPQPGQSPAPGRSPSRPGGVTPTSVPPGGTTVPVSPTAPVTGSTPPGTGTVVPPPASASPTPAGLVGGLLDTLTTLLKPVINLKGSG